MRHRAEQDAATPQSVARGRRDEHVALSARAACVLLCRGVPPADLMEMLRRKELRPAVVGTLSAALAELIVIEKRGEGAGAREPVILLVVEPGEFADLDALVDAAARSAPRAVLWRFARGSTPRLASLTGDRTKPPVSKKATAVAAYAGANASTPPKPAPAVTPTKAEAPEPAARPVITFVPNWPVQHQRVIQTRVLTPDGYAAPISAPSAPAPVPAPPHKLRLVDADDSRHASGMNGNGVSTNDRRASDAERMPEPVVLSPEEVKLLLSSDAGDGGGNGHAHGKGGGR